MTFYLNIKGKKYVPIRKITFNHSYDASTVFHTFLYQFVNYNVYSCKKFDMNTVSCLSSKGPRNS